MKQGWLKMKKLIALLCMMLFPLYAMAEDTLQDCNVNDLEQALKAWNAPALTCEVNEQGVVYFAQWDGKSFLSQYGIRIVTKDGESIEYIQLVCLNGDPKFFRVGLGTISDDQIEEASQWIEEHLDGETMDSIKCTLETVELELSPIGVLIVRPNATSEKSAVDDSFVEKRFFDHKPGIAGSNAYDLTIGAEENGLTVGKRQQTTDGYSWLISGTTYYGSYTISIETNKQYEIHRATFAHAGNDATFFPWAVTLPFDAADIEGATAWVKACQKADQEATFVAGDAVWTYIPHENGQHGGVLTLTVDMFEEYSRYLLNQL